MAAQTQPKKHDNTSAQNGRKKNLTKKITPQQPAKIDPKNLEALRILREWDNFTPAEIEEQKETWAFLKKALDEDRLSPDRPHFPDNGDAS